LEKDSYVDYPNTYKVMLILAFYMLLGKISLSCLFISMPERQRILIFALLSAEPFVLMLACLQKLMLGLSDSNSCERGALYYRTWCPILQNVVPYTKERGALYYRMWCPILQNTSSLWLFLMWRCRQSAKKLPTAFNP